MICQRQLRKSACLLLPCSTRALERPETPCTFRQLGPFRDDQLCVHTVFKNDVNMSDRRQRQHKEHKPGLHKRQLEVRETEAGGPAEVSSSSKGPSEKSVQARAAAGMQQSRAKHRCVSIPSVMCAYKV